jgi:hypothetical protein
MTPHFQLAENVKGGIYTDKAIGFIGGLKQGMFDKAIGFIDGLKQGMCCKK